MRDRVPPSNQDAEVQVIGAAMLSAEGATAVLDLLKPGDFYVPANGEIFRAMRSLADTGKPIDLIHLANQLRTSGKLDAIGGPGYLAGVANEVHTTALIEHHAALVAECAVRREMLRAASQMAKLAYDDATPIPQAIEQAERAVVAIGQRQVVGDMQRLGSLTTKVYTTIGERADGTAPEGVYIGLSEVDEILGGFRPGQLIILAARPGMGKSALAMQIALNVAKAQRSVAVFSLEMDGESLTERLLSGEAKMSANKLRHGYVSDDEWVQLAKASGRLGNLPMFLDDAPGASISSMRAKCRRLAVQEGPIGLIVIDYLQLLEGGGNDNNRVQEISKFSRGLKLLAREFKVPVLALSQLNRQVEQRPNKRPQQSDLRDSGSIEQDADVVLFIYRDEHYNPNGSHQGEAEIIVAKQRGGATGTATVTFIKDQTRFTTSSLAVEA